MLWGVGMVTVSSLASEAGQSHLGLAVLIFKEGYLDPSRVKCICLGILLYCGLVCLSLGPSGLGAQLSFTASS